MGVDGAEPTKEHPSVSPCHCLTVRQAARRITQLYDRHLADVDLRSTQYAVLATLDRYGALAVTELARLLVMDRTATGRTVRPLQRDGLVHAGIGRDARARSLSLTDLGRERLAAARVPWRAAQAAFEAEYGASDADRLRFALGRVVGRS